MKKLKVGIIGAGRFATKAHYPSLNEIEQVDLRAICENTNTEHMNELAEQYKIPEQYTDYKKMLANVEIDVVYALLRPTYGLLPIVCDILAAEKHLFIEKPPAMSVADMKIMVEAAQKSRSYTMVAFNRRFIPLLIEAKRRVREQSSISLIIATFYKHELNNDWPPGKQLLSNGIHAVDTLRWLAESDVKEISVTASKTFSEYNNSWQALIRFENGIIGVLLTSYSVGARRHTFEIHGRGISAFVDPDDEGKIYKNGKGKDPLILESKKVAGSDKFIDYYGIKAENQYFINSILNRNKPDTDFEEALKTMELVEKIEKGKI
jgi:virulence factor